MEQKKLNEILKKHRRWLNDEVGGEKADLRGADLYGANLRRADLRRADLYGANLRRADLYGADLRWANLRRADLRGADPCGADLRGADLRWADLRGADLDFSCLPLWCGGQFKADKKICQQLVAHALRICELSGCGSELMLSAMRKYIKGWHHEHDF